MLVVCVGGGGGGGPGGEAPQERGCQQLPKPAQAITRDSLLSSLRPPKRADYVKIRVYVTHIVQQHGANKRSELREFHLHPGNVK